MKSKVLNSPSSVICFGEVLWDILPDGPLAGGAPLNVCYHLNKLGVSAKVITRIGTDQSGNRLKKLMRTQGMSLDLVQQDSKNKTGEVIANIGNGQEVVYDIVTNVAWDQIAEQAEHVMELSHARYLVYGTLATRSNVSRATLFKLLEKPVIKVLDVNLRPPFIDRKVLEQLLLRADIVKCNEHEFNFICNFYQVNGNDHERFAVLRSIFDIKELIITKGKSGASYFTGSDIYRSTTPAVDVQDTIGSGDAFLAAFIAHHFQNTNPEITIQKASAMGAFIASKKGGCPDYKRTEFTNFSTN